MNLLQQPLIVQFLSMVVNRVQRHNYCMQPNKHTKQVECRFGFSHGLCLLASLEKIPHSKHWNLGASGMIAILITTIACLLLRG